MIDFINPLDLIIVVMLLIIASIGAYIGFISECKKTTSLFIAMLLSKLLIKYVPFLSNILDPLFLYLIIHALKDGGRCGMVLPQGFLFGDGVTARIKEKLFETCNLHTIIKLPMGVFNPYTGIPTNLIFFDKGKPTKEVWYFEHPYPEGYKSYSRTKPIRIEEFDLEKQWWNNRVEGEYSWKVPASEIQKNNYYLDINNPKSEQETIVPPVQEMINIIEQNQNKISETLSDLISNLK